MSSRRPSGSVRRRILRVKPQRRLVQRHQKFRSGSNMHSARGAELVRAVADGLHRMVYGLFTQSRLEKTVGPSSNSFGASTSVPLHPILIAFGVSNRHLFNRFHIIVYLIRNYSMFNEHLSRYKKGNLDGPEQEE